MSVDIALRQLLDRQAGHAIDRQLLVEGVRSHLEQGTIASPACLDFVCQRLDAALDSIGPGPDTVGIAPEHAAAARRLHEQHLEVRHAWMTLALLAWVELWATQQHSGGNAPL